MNRPFYILIIFGLCLLLLFGAMGWVSLTVLRLDRIDAEAREQAALEEKVRLALWRMDSALIPFIAQESARPYFSYSAFYPAERVYTRMFSEIKKGDVLVPSPLLAQASSYIFLHFQFGPEGRLTSPQVPTGNMRDLAEMGYTTHDKIAEAEDRLQAFQAILSREKLLAAIAQGSSQSPPSVLITANRQPERVQPIEQQQFMSNTAEWQARAQISQQATSKASIAQAFPEASSNIREGVMVPVWIDSALLLARQVSVNGKQYVQGCWLEWPALRIELRENIQDLLPEASFESAKAGSIDERERILTALPIKLIPGSLPKNLTMPVSPLGLSLLIAWICVLVAAFAVAVLLMGTLSLSERRGAFVSSVTHELRTPLTTLRMYTDMLSEDMVPDEKKKGKYIKTMQAEADRLSHLVENVLTYARLEKNRSKIYLENISLNDLLGRIKDRLIQRVNQSGMHLIIEDAKEGHSIQVRVDPSAVEQILFNLVDNACKYASVASDKGIHLVAERAGDYAQIMVRDYGPGISQKDVRQLFRPFRKSAKDAANSAPGVGLGLALSNRLASMMRGKIRLDKNVKDGACFLLLLPVV